MSYDANGPNYCISDTEYRMHGKLIAQTIFLGASVMDYNCNLGWGTQPSTLTVNLVNDNAAPLIDTSPEDTAVGCGDEQHPSTDPDRPGTNDYYQGLGGDIYINKDNVPCSVHDPTARVKAKVAYQTNFPAATAGRDAEGFEFRRPYDSGTLQVDQYWWTKKDPGFLGDANNIQLNGNVVAPATNRLYSLPESEENPDGFPPTDFLDFYNNRGYNITNSPVFFKMGDFSFGGFVQSWKKNKSNSGDIYTVVVNSPQSILNTCTVILDQYGGSIAGSLDSFNWSAPTNYVGNKLKYNTTDNSYGNIPNVFNVYGFLESFGVDYFGGSSYKQEEGFLVTDIVMGLRVLAGADDLTLRASTANNDFGPKNAFSPFGRIIAPTAHDPITGDFVTTNKWGLIAPTQGRWTGNNRCQFRLDLSDLQYAITGSDKRIKADSMSISELIDQICEDHGLDWTTSMINTSEGWVIKVVAVSRRFAPLVNGIQSTVSKLVCDNFPVGSLSYGKEKNDASSRSLVIGPNQQRLYQTKNTRLAYTQSVYIYNPGDNVEDGEAGGCFVDYYTLGKITVPALSSVDCDTNTGTRVSVDSSKTFGYGKIRFPAFFSNRNPALDNRPTSLKNDEAVKAELGLAFNDRDSVFEDSELNPSATQIRSGNYGQSKFISHGVDTRYGLDPCAGTSVTTLDILEGSNIAEQSKITARRFFPLYRDTICPFFGYLLENRYKIDAQNANTDFRRIRPVWYDFWTGQICVLFHKDELPATRINLAGRYTSYKLNRASNVNILNSSVSFHTKGFDSDAPPEATEASPEPETATPSYTAEWFMVTESEIRSAMAGNDSFAAYNLGKIYKTDIYIMLHSAYVARSKAKFIDEGHSDSRATEMALKENDWKWSFTNENTCGPEGNADLTENTGSTSMATFPGEARKDLDLVAAFIKSVGQEYYGKRYMVTAPYLQSRTEREPYSFSLSNDQGTINVFKGGGEIRHSYEPCSDGDGAWEEYGNQIDDNIVCGDENWASLSNDKGQINPILGYNATYSFDYQRFALAKSSKLNAQNVLLNSDVDDLHPYFSYSAWDDAQALKRGDGLEKHKFYFENLLLSDLASNAGSFVIVDCMATNSLENAIASQNPFTPSPKVTGLDAFGQNHGAIKRKLYINCNVSPKFSFLDPEKMLDPRMIVETNVLRLNNSSEQYQSDPANTVAATIGMEDLAIYTRAGGRSPDRIKILKGFFQPFVSTFGSLQKSNSMGGNPTAQNTKISPKCAHPLFAGIPIKSNIYSYGPWTNYPALSPTSEIFATGIETYIGNSNINYSSCQELTLDLPSDDQKHKLIDNWIGDTKFEVVSDFAPWNFGGMRGLDENAVKYVSGNANYQTDIEVGSIDIAGSPIFNLGGSFGRNATNGYIKNVNQKEYFVFKEIKSNLAFAAPILTELDEYMLENPSYLEGTIPYAVADVSVVNEDGNRIRHDSYTQAPILTNIMTSMGQNGITTKYSFRTYTRKLSLFDRQDIERFKKMAQQNMLRKKEISNLKRSVVNNRFTDRQKIRRGQIDAGNIPENSMTYGTSPVTTIVCTAHKFLPKFSGLDEKAMLSSFSAPGLLLGTEQANAEVRYQHSADPGGSGHLVGGFSDQSNDSQLPYLYLEHRVNTDTKIYTDSELGDSLRDEWSNSSVMSLDGIFSPISFYPTNTKSTYSISKYDRESCPICAGTKKVKRTYKKYPSSEATLATGIVEYYCDSCVKPYEKLHAAAYSSTVTTTAQGELYPPFITTTGNSLEELKKYNALVYQSQIKDKTARLGLSLNIPINITTLQPIVMPQHEFRNANAQNYVGSHPDGAHQQLQIAEKNRTFVDKGRNSISIIGRGSIYKEIVGAGFRSQTHLSQPGSVSKSTPVKNYDYDYLDSRFIDRFSDTDYPVTGISPEHNMRFVGLRGPMMIHGWGYDTEGYPVPNACDEPVDIDEFGRPKRFKRTRTLGPAVTYSSLAVGSAFLAESGNDKSETVKLANLTLQNDTDWSRGGGGDIGLSTDVYSVFYNDDLNEEGGYEPDEGYDGSIISKTQSYGTNGWTKKIKLKQFYLNWAERPDMWPVGPVDLRWDENRKVWGMTSPKVYKDVYITLEEDMVKDPDLDETFPARGFFDDASYSTQALADNQRKLVYVRDRSGYTAPRGARLFCRYDTDTGYYEPISKQQFIVYGTTTPGTNTATITMSYVQGKKKGDGAPSMVVTFKNPLTLSTINGVGMFTYSEGTWTLISTKD